MNKALIAATLGVTVLVGTHAPASAGEYPTCGYAQHSCEYAVPGLLHVVTLGQYASRCASSCNTPTYGTPHLPAYTPCGHVHHASPCSGHYRRGYYGNRGYHHTHVRTKHIEKSVELRKHYRVTYTHSVRSPY